MPYSFLWCKIELLQNLAYIPFICISFVFVFSVWFCFVSLRFVLVCFINFTKLCCMFNLHTHFNLIECNYSNRIGSIAEREHMKWKNAVELPNNPYSAEALQRRLSQTSHSKFTDIERLTSKFTTTTTTSSAATKTATEAAATTASNQLETRTPPHPQDHMDKPIKVVLGSHQVDSERCVSKNRPFLINF